MARSIALIPALATGRLALGSLRAGAGWVRFAQWDAVVTNFAIGGVLGSAALGLARRALR
jgi:hypothetical protein